MQKTIVQRAMQLYNRKRQAVGVFVGTVANGKIQVGWSRVHFSKGDTFHMGEGVKVAIKNLDTNPCFMTNARLNNDWFIQYNLFLFRCQKFFKDKEFSDTFKAHVVKTTTVPEIR